ncbi:hypothetical protein BH11PSE2_BH11PSE2_11250 [soil metagenome]
MFTKTLTLGLTLALAGACASAQTPAPQPAPKLTEVASPGAAKDHAAAYRTDIIEVPLAAAGDPKKGHEVEYMVRMKSGDPLVYSWDAPATANVWHEFHGHTPTTVTFYKKASGAAHRGSLTAPFDGIHGWYFENRTDKPVVIRIHLSGFYELMPPKK